MTTDGTEEGEELVIPTMGTDMGGGAICLEVVYAWGCCTCGATGISDGCNLSAKRSMRPEDGEPNKATSSCCTASMCKRSASQWM